MKIIISLLAALACASCALFDRGWEEAYVARLRAEAAVPREPAIAAPLHRIGWMPAVASTAAQPASAAAAPARFRCHDGSAVTLERNADGARAIWSDGATMALRRVEREGGLALVGEAGAFEQSGAHAVWRGGQGAVTVVAGDTLSAIAARHGGLSVQRILDANPEIADPDRIEIGQILRLPGAAPARRCRRVA